ALLARRGYKVIASTGRPETHEYLTSLGASGFIAREELSQKGPPLAKERWAAAVDSVGGQTLATVLSQMTYGGWGAACALAGADAQAQACLVAAGAGPAARQARPDDRSASDVGGAGSGAEDSRRPGARPGRHRRQRVNVRIPSCVASPRGYDRTKIVMLPYKTSSREETMGVIAAEKPPFLHLELATPRIRRTPLPGGGFLLESEDALGDYDAHIGLLLQRQAQAQPDGLFLAERDGNGGWRKVTYGQAWAYARSIAQALIDRGLDQSQPVLILSGNSIDHALMMLGGFVAGVPVAPVSVAYSLMSDNFAKVHHIYKLVRPKVVFAEKAAMFTRVLQSLPLDRVEVVSSDGAAGTRLQALLDTRPTDAVDARFAAIGPDSVAKYLFTSGSTGLPKGVINTHRMMVSNQQALAQIWPFLEKKRLT